MPRIRILGADGQMTEYDAVNVDVPESFLTVETPERVIGIPERLISRIEIEGVSLQPSADSSRR